MINNLCNKRAYTYTGILAFLVFLFYGVTPGHTENLFVLKSSALQTLAPKFMEFNEELDETANEKELDRALWTPKLKTYQSFVTGYWVRFSIRNNTENRFIGLNHNFSIYIFSSQKLRPQVFLIWLKNLYLRLLANSY